MHAQNTHRPTDEYEIHNKPIPAEIVGLHSNKLRKGYRLLILRQHNIDTAIYY